MTFDVIIGIRGPIASPTLCNGLMVPIVAFEQIYSFNRDELIKSVPKPEKAKDAQIEAAAEALQRGDAIDRQPRCDRRAPRVELLGHALPSHLREGSGRNWAGQPAHRGRCTCGAFE